MITLPPELIEQIKFHCNNNDLGMSVISADELVIITMGNSEIPPNYIHLLAAHMMISGVLTGDWATANEKVAEEKEHEKEKERKPF